LSLLSENLYNELSSVGVDVLRDANLTKYSTMKLSSTGDLITVKTVDQLKEVIKLLVTHKISYKPIGWGANLVLPEKPDFIFIKLDLPFDKKEVDPSKKSYKLSATAPLNVLTSLATKHGLSGWEVFTGVPASLGGAVFMNAGTSLGEIGELIEEVTLLRKSGVIETVSINENSFSYRENHFVKDGDIILEVVIKHNGIDSKVGDIIKSYLKKRTDTQPLREKTCGCMFKNSHEEVEGTEITCRAGLYIDIMGLKGLSSGDMRVSPKHANFMENKGSSSSTDVKELVGLTLNELEFHYGVKFETEVDLP
jgi:UDP-N-acetylmuramate dehydrogenase